MILPTLALLSGFALLVWSAAGFVGGAAATAKHLGVPALVIGMVVVGFGTSLPEMIVSAMASLDGNPELAIGNALGSTITNTGLILGLTAVIAPIVVHSSVVRRELPILLLIGSLIGWVIWDLALTRVESLLLLVGFFALIGWSIYTGLRAQGDHLEVEIEQELETHEMSLRKALLWLVGGLILLGLSSRMLVWGAVSIAEALGVSSLIIGLTIVALGTSLPELAASIIAARKGEHDIAIGNVVGSNMFNLLAVVGIAGTISPMPYIEAEVLSRDWPVMMAMTLALLLMAYGIRSEGKITRPEGALLLFGFIAYNIYLLATLTLVH